MIVLLTVSLLLALGCAGETEVVSFSTDSRSNGSVGGSLRDQIHLLEAREIRSALERNAWNKSRAAIELGISYPSLLSKIKRYCIRSY